MLITKAIIKITTKAIIKLITISRIITKITTNPKTKEKRISQAKMISITLLLIKLTITHMKRNSNMEKLNMKKAGKIFIIKTKLMKKKKKNITKVIKTITITTKKTIIITTIIIIITIKTGIAKTKAIKAMVTITMIIALLKIIITTVIKESNLIIIIIITIRISTKRKMTK